MSAGRLRLLLAVALVLLVVVDFTRRVHVPRHVQPRDAASFVPADVAPPLTAAIVNRDLATWLPGLAPVAEGAGAAAGTDWALTLLAVFSERGAPFAVIRATPAAGGAPRVQRIAQGDEIYGFKVAQIEPQRVRLEGAGGAHDLQIFKPAQPAVQGSGAPPAAKPAAVALPETPVAHGAAAAGTGPAPAQAQAPAVAAGPKQVQATELQPGQAFELPASMRGLKVVDAPVPPPKSDAGGKSPQPQPAPPPQKP